MYFDVNEVFISNPASIWPSSLVQGPWKILLITQKMRASIRNQVSFRSSLLRTMLFPRQTIRLEYLCHHKGQRDSVLHPDEETPNLTVVQKLQFPDSRIERCHRPSEECLGLAIPADSAKQSAVATRLPVGNVSS